MSALNNFANQLGSNTFNFDTVPDLQPRALMAIIRQQKLPEENVLRNIIATVPVSDKLFQNMIDDGIDLSMTPETDMNADDPMIGDNYEWSLDQIHEYRQGAKINREVGQQLMNPNGSAARYAGMSILQRYMNRITTAIDNRREYNRAMALLNAHKFNPSRAHDLAKNNVITITNAKDKWDCRDRNPSGDKLIVNPFNQLSAAKERFGFLTGTYPNCIVIPSDVYSALETHDDWANESRATPVMAGARARIRDLDVFVSLSRKDVGDGNKAKLLPTFDNTVVLARIGVDSISEKQYGINTVDQFTTADRLFYYVRYWHKSKVTVERPTNFMYIKDVLANPFVFDDVNSLLR